MDEFDRGMDPQMRRYLKKVLNTVFVGLFWMILTVLFGIYFQWAFPYHGQVDAFNIFFYVYFLGTLAALIWFFCRTWRS